MEKVTNNDWDTLNSEVDGHTELSFELTVSSIAFLRSLLYFEFGITSSDNFNLSIFQFFSKISIFLRIQFFSKTFNFRKFLFRFFYFERKCRKLQIAISKLKIKTWYLYLTFGAKYQTLAIITRSGNVHFNIIKLDKIINTLNHIFILNFLPWGHFAALSKIYMLNRAIFSEKWELFWSKMTIFRHEMIISCRFHPKIDIFSPIQNY